MNSKFNKFTETELAQEQWRDVEGYDGMYQVSDLGRVRSRKSGEWKVLSQGKVRGYLQVVLSKGGKCKNYKVHRLVAQAFIQNDDDSKTQINHRDECKQNNRLWNLEYCTAQYNTTYNDIHHRRWINRNDYKYPKIKKLYNPDLTIKQNIEVFRENGIECSRETVLKLRRDLNLKPHLKYKRDRVKSLYRHELTIDENLELFKANGISCSRETVKRLRKDIGLIKTN